MQSSKWVSLLVLSALLSSAPTFARAAAPTLAAEKAAARVQASLSQKDQTFQAGPGICRDGDGRGPRTRIHQKWDLFLLWHSLCGSHATL